MPVAAMLLATVFWASAMIGNKILVHHMAVSEVALGRFAFGAVLLWLLAGLAGQWRHVRTADRRPLLMGLIEPGMVGMLFIWGQSYTSATHATVFWALMPLLMPLLGRLVLKERLRPVNLVAAVIAGVGTWMLVAGRDGSGEASLFGDLLCFAGVLCGCMNQLLARRVAQTGGRPLLTSAMQVSAAAFLSLVVMVAIERPQPSLGHQSGDIYLLLAYMGIAGSAGPFLLYNYALRHIAVANISLFPPLVAPIGAAMAGLFLAEPISAGNLVAIAIILLAVFLPPLMARLGGARRTAG